MACTNGVNRVADARRHKKTPQDVIRMTAAKECAKFRGKPEAAMTAKPMGR